MAIEPGLNQLEGEVEAARSKLASDLATLRAPDTTAEFTEALKQEALDVRDSLVVKAKATVQSSIESLIEELKARAAANPAATLIIGSGLAWRLIRHPPIATILVGAGLLSLFRTSPAPMSGAIPADYLQHAKSRLAEQAGEAVQLAKEKTAALTEAGGEKVTEGVAKIKERVQDVAAQATSAAANVARSTRSHAATMWTETTDVVGEVRESARSAATNALSHARQGDAWQLAGNTLSHSEGRDKLLLATAGAAVAMALGIAAQRHLTQHAEPN